MFKNRVGGSGFLYFIFLAYFCVMCRKVSLIHN